MSCRASGPAPAARAVMASTSSGSVKRASAAPASLRTAASGSATASRMPAKQRWSTRKAAAWIMLMRTWGSDALRMRSSTVCSAIGWSMESRETAACWRTSASAAPSWLSAWA